VGLALAISGAAVLAGSVIVDTAVLGPTLDDFRASKLSGDGHAADHATSVQHLQTGLLVGYSIGGVLAVTGTVLWLWPTKTSRVSVSLGPAGMHLDVRW
jgi:hypothetical protein